MTAFTAQQACSLGLLLPGRNRFLGNQLQTDAEYRIGRHVLVTLNPAWFLTNASLHGPPRGHNIDYDAALVTFRF